MDEGSDEGERRAPVVLAGPQATAGLARKARRTGLDALSWHSAMRSSGSKKLAPEGGAQQPQRAEEALEAG